jgi:uncharacterized protein YodC (DUF2158 family)
MTTRIRFPLKANLIELPQSNSHLSFVVKRSFRMPSSKEFTFGAGMAILLSLPFSLPAWSASNIADLSTKETIAPQLHQGDLVRLRSGGPLMTVSGINGDQVECIWTDLYNGQTDDATFPAKILQKF